MTASSDGTHATSTEASDSDSEGDSQDEFYKLKFSKKDLDMDPSSEEGGGPGLKEG